MGSTTVRIPVNVMVGAMVGAAVSAVVSAVVGAMVGAVMVLLKLDSNLIGRSSLAEPLFTSSRPRQPGVRWWVRWWVLW